MWVSRLKLVIASKKKEISSSYGGFIMEAYCEIFEN
jgi:hypothetical protein